jgi:hypothetical protein
VDQFLQQLADRAARASAYFQLRSRHPEAPARLTLAYVSDPAGLDFDQFLCERTTGHSWAFTGSAYGGDDDRWGGEGRCYCSRCGADGDA